jgi:hypothetical protein
VRGAIRSDPDPSDQSFGWTAFRGEPLPVQAGARPPSADPNSSPPIRVWRDGAKVRIEEPGGAPNLIVGEKTCWWFDDEHEAPVEATTFLGRPAWTVELAPPPHKPHPLQLIVDAYTGLVLQQRNDDFGTVNEWVEFVVAERIDPALFQWDGPIRTDAEQQAEWRAADERDTARRQRWFAENVAAPPLVLELQAEVGVHVYDERTGAFEGSFGHGFGSVARRPHSDEPWDLRWHDVQHRWSTAQWDWAVTLFRDLLTPAGLEALRRQLTAGPA